MPLRDGESSRLTPVDVLVTRTTADRFGRDILAVGTDVRLLAMERDGGIVGPEGPVASDDLAPEVVFATADLFDEGQPVIEFFAVAATNPAVRWFQSPAAGTDHPVFATIVERGVRLSTGHSQDVPIAEFVLRAVLDHRQDAAAWRLAQAAGEWRAHEFREVLGSTWLVIGLGAIGSAVAVRARAFGATVIGVRRHPDGDEPVDEMVAPDRIGSFLGAADVVVLAAPGTVETESLVDAAFLAAMSPGSMLVNVGRGSLVDEEALLAALDRGIPDRAVLDVVRREPLPAGHPFWTHPRVVLTPHSSAGGDGRFARLAALFCENLGRYRSGEPLRHEVTEADR